MNSVTVKRKIRRQSPPYLRFSLLAEGLTVGALVHGGICLMGTYQDPLQRAEISILAMVGALLNGTLNALVCMAIHGYILLLFMMGLDCPHAQKTYIS